MESSPPLDDEIHARRQQRNGGDQLQELMQLQSDAHAAFMSLS